VFSVRMCCSVSLVLVSFSFVIYAFPSLGSCWMSLAILSFHVLRLVFPLLGFCFLFAWGISLTAPGYQVDASYEDWLFVWWLVSVICSSFGGGSGAGLFQLHYSWRWHIYRVYIVSDLPLLLFCWLFFGWLWQWRLFSLHEQAVFWFILLEWEAEGWQNDCFLCMFFCFGRVAFWLVLASWSMDVKFGCSVPWCCSRSMILSLIKLHCFSKKNFPGCNFRTIL